jgi:hypothetical protein
MSIQLIFRDSFAAVELLDAAPDLCVDCFPVLHEPTILFFLGLQQTEQDSLDAAGSLKLFLDAVNIEKLSQWLTPIHLTCYGTSSAQVAELYSMCLSVKTADRGRIFQTVLNAGRCSDVFRAREHEPQDHPVSRYAARVLGEFSL